MRLLVLKILLTATAFFGVFTSRISAKPRRSMAYVPLPDRLVGEIKVYWQLEIK